jgi:hypothetical protein
MKRLPKIASDRAAEVFVARADLRDYDLSTMQRVQFEFDLKAQVVPVVDKMRANPKRAIPAKKVFTALRAHHAARMKADKK